MQVKANLGENTETLVSQAKEMWDRWRRKRRGEYVDLSHVKALLFPNALITSSDRQPLTEAEDAGAPLMVEDAVATVPGISEGQVVEIFTSAERAYKAANQKALSMSDAIENIHTISDRLDQIHCSCCELVTLQTMIASRASQALKASATSTGNVTYAPNSIGCDTAAASADVSADAFEEVAGELQRLAQEVARRFQRLTQTHAQLHATARSLAERISSIEQKLGPLAGPLPQEMQMQQHSAYKLSSHPDSDGGDKKVASFVPELRGGQSQ